MSYPQVVVHFDKLLHNADTVLDWCKVNNVDVALVGKCVSADKTIVNKLLQRNFAIYADSREENLESIDFRPRMLLRVGMPQNAERIVQCAEISLQSEIATIKLLEKAAAKHNVIHKIVLMVDLGDLREGVLFCDKESLLATAKEIVQSPHLQLYAVGTNLTCYGSVVPTEENLGTLVAIRDFLEKELGVTIPVISGGNSSSVGLMNEGKMPKQINMLRLGEVILLGTDTAVGSKFEQLNDDAFVLEAQLVEVKTKPSMPIGKQSVNAFGEKVVYHDKGIMLRGIVAVGRQDVELDGLTPLDSRVEIVGGSSDHLLLDLTKAPHYKVGDVVRFKLSYGALLSCFTGKYVSKVYQDN